MSPISTVCNEKNRTVIDAFMNYFLDNIIAQKISSTPAPGILSREIPKDDRFLVATLSATRDILSEDILGTDGCYECIPVICLTFTETNISYRIVHLPVIVLAKQSEEALKQSVRDMFQKDFSDTDLLLKMRTAPTIIMMTRKIAAVLKALGKLLLVK